MNRLILSRFASEASRRRRGVAMLLVLIAVVVAMVLATSFVVTQSVGPRMAVNAADQSRARQIAESGVTLALARMRADPSWRSNYSEGTWVNSQSLFGGTLSVRVNDGTWDSTTQAVVGGDGNLADSATEPCVITATAVYQNATYVTRMQVTPGAATTLPGLNVDYFARSGSLTQLSDIPWTSTPTYSTVVPNVNRPQENSTMVGWPGGPNEYWGARYSGFITIPRTGTWTFYTNSDDGSSLYVNNVLVVNNDGLHSMTTRSGTATLNAGTYPFEVRFFENAVDQGVIAYWSGPGVSSQTIIPASAFTRPNTGPTITGAGLTNTITMSGNSRIDALDSSAAAYATNTNATGAATVSTNSTSSAQVTLQNSATINGTVYIGPGGNTSSGVSTSGSAGITGGSSTLPAAVTVPSSVTTPTGLPSSASNSSFPNSGSQTLSSGTYRYNNFNVGNNFTLNLNGRVTIYCNGTFTIDNSGAVLLASGSTVQIFAASFVIKNNANLNMPASGSANPGTLLLIQTGGGTFTVDNSAVVVGQVFVPNGAVSISNNGSVFGTIRARTLGLANSARFTQDLYLAPANVSGGGGSSGSSSMSVLWLEQP